MTQFTFLRAADPLTRKQTHSIILPPPCWTVGKHIAGHCGQTAQSQSIPSYIFFPFPCEHVQTFVKF